MKKALRFVTLSLMLLMVTSYAAASSDSSFTGWGPIGSDEDFSVTARYGDNTLTGAWELAIWDKDPSSSVEASEDYTWTKNVWYEFELEYDQATGEVTWTVDGEELSWTTETGKNFGTFALIGKADGTDGDTVVSARNLELNGNSLTNDNFDAEDEKEGVEITMDSGDQPDGFTISGEFLFDWNTTTADERPSFEIYAIDLDTDAPEISDPTATPEYPTCSDDVEVCVDVTDFSDIDFVSLHIDTGIDTATFAMFHEGGDTYCRSVSADTLSAEDGMEVEYTIEAGDEYGNEDEIPEEDVFLFVFDCEAPEASFTCDVTSGDEPLDVECTDESTDSVDSDLDLLWSDGSTDSVFTITYNQDGSYTITLTVTDDAGHTDSASETITVFDVMPEPSFTVTPHPGEEGVVMFFNDTSTSHDDIISWAWGFGDGSGEAGGSEAQHVEHTYDDDGVYLVSLTVCDDEDCVTAYENITVDNVAPTAVMDNESYYCDEGSAVTLTVIADDVDADTISYLWETGDTTASISYDCENGDDDVTVEVTVSDEDGGSTVIEADVSIANVAPTANANGDYETAVGHEVCFYGSATDPWDTSFDFTWDFDYDGSDFDSDDSGEEVCTSYSEHGVYTIGVVADDGDDESEVATATVTVHKYGIDLDEAWNLFSIPLVPVDDNTSIQFVLGGDIPAKADILWEYRWDEDEGRNVWKYNEPIADGSRWSNANGRVDEIIPGYGYYIRMDNATILYGDGEKFYNYGGPGSLPPQVELTTGWNLIGKYGLNEVHKSDQRWDLAGASSVPQSHLATATLLDENAVPVFYTVHGEGYWAFITSSNNVLYGPSIADYSEDDD